MATTALTLVLGGARSGKSALAEHLASGSPPVTYVATGPAPDADDPGWAARVAAHAARRPSSWATLEVSGSALAPALLEAAGTALFDSLGTWVASLGERYPPDGGLPGSLEPVLDALRERRGRGWATVVVSEEVGLGVHPSTAVGGWFRDALGDVNRAVGDVADSVLLVVAGRVLTLGERVPEGGGGAVS